MLKTKLCMLVLEAELCMPVADENWDTYANTAVYDNGKFSHFQESFINQTVLLFVEIYKFFF